MKNSATMRNLVRKLVKLNIPIFLLATALNVVVAGYAAGEIIPPERRINWSGNVGVPGGVPARTTICGTASSATYGNDSADATSHIQGLINSCPVGQVVYLPAGTYRISSQLSINKGIVLRGAGPANTVIKWSGSNSGYMISMGNGSLGGTSIDIGSGYTKGSTSLTLASTTNLAVGDLIWIDQLNDGVEVNSNGAGGACTWCGRLNGTRSSAQISMITAINGTTVTIDPAMHETLSSSLSPQVVEISSVTTNAGVEDLKLYATPNTPSYNMRMWGVKYSWVKNIESQRPHIGGSAGCYHNWIGYSYRSEVRDSYFHENTQTGSNSYGLEIVYGTTGFLVENNMFTRLKANVLFGWAGGGNVVGYNYNHAFQNDGGYFSGDLSFHAAFPKQVLAEGNYGMKWRVDNYWGSNARNTAFRNYFSATQPAGEQSISGNRYPMQIDKWSWKNNIVGNVLGAPGTTWVYQYNGSGCTSSPNIWHLGYTGDGSGGCGGTHDPQVFATLLRHGNFDYSTNTTKWCNDPGEPGCQGGDGSHTIPNSLYLGGRPGWWCNELPWPPIGPDLSPMVSDIPAKRRFEGQVCTTSGVTTPPPPLPSPVPPPPPPADNKIPLPPSGIIIQ